MSYYYEDTSHYRYSVPAHREDMPHYYHTMSTQLVDTSQYSFSEPTHYDNITPNSIEHACELEAYAEAMANRTYSWDEIHPAYCDHLTDSYCEPSQPLTDDEEYYEDVTDEVLAEMNHRCMEYQKQLVERKVEDVNEMGTVEVSRGEDQEDYDDKYEGDGEDITVDYLLSPLLPSHSQPVCLPHHISCDNIITTPPLDIHTPNPHPPSPNIWYVFTGPHHHHQNHHLPDIITPPPLPLKPNIVPFGFLF